MSSRGNQTRLRPPGKGEFAKRTQRYTDKAGRLYILPTKSDPILESYSNLHQISPNAYDRELRRGLSFDPRKDSVKLLGNVILYVQLPTLSRAAFNSIADDRDDPVWFPQPEGLARTQEESTLTLFDSNTGRRYTGSVERVVADRRSRRGHVFLRDVSADDDSL